MLRPAAPDATHCPACGAALAQRESIAGLVIPGVTTVDPALQAWDAQPLHIPGASPTQGAASAALGAAVLGGPVGLVAAGGLAALAATEYLGVTGGGRHAGDLETLGQPSEAALQAVERLEREGEPPAPPQKDHDEGSRHPRPMVSRVGAMPFASRERHRLAMAIRGPTRLKPEAATW